MLWFKVNRVTPTENLQVKIGLSFTVYLKVNKTPQKGTIIVL